MNELVTTELYNVRRGVVVNGMGCSCSDYKTETRNKSEYKLPIDCNPTT